MANATELTTDSYYLAGIVSPGFENVSGQQLTRGINLFNDVISESAISATLIDYDSHLEIDTVIGQEIYFVPGLVELSVLSFNLDDVRYYMTPLTRNVYFGQSRVDNITSLPLTYYAERTMGGMNLYLYYVPDQIYNLNLTGKIAYLPVVPSTNLDLGFERFHQSYFKYKLAKRLCDFNTVPFPQQSHDELISQERNLSKLTVPDMTASTTTIFLPNPTDPFTQANLGKGFEPL